MIDTINFCVYIKTLNHKLYQRINDYISQYTRNVIIIVENNVGFDVLMDRKFPIDEIDDYIVKNIIIIVIYTHNTIDSHAFDIAALSSPFHT